MKGVTRHEAEQGKQFRSPSEKRARGLRREETNLGRVGAGQEEFAEEETNRPRHTRGAIG